MIPKLKNPALHRAVTCTLGCLQQAWVRSAHSAAATHYEVLGVHTAASPEQIKAAFRQKAKELHPDLNAQWSASDGEAFLQIVTAYEVLSDPQQRQLYDMSQDQALPTVLRCSPPQAQEDGAPSILSWRYGLSAWAAQGPATADIATANSHLQWSVASALARHRRELEQDLHTALIKAYLGPQLSISAGQLPPAFEADERADPSLTAELLHLVHGRVLIGVVRLKQPLALEGASTSTTALSGFQHTPAAIPPPAAALPAACQGTGLTDQDAPAAARNLLQKQQQLIATGAGQEAWGNRQLHEHQQTGACAPADCSADATGEVADNHDDVISDKEWHDVVRRQHTLRGYYDWAASTAESTAQRLPEYKLPAQVDACVNSSCSHSSRSSAPRLDDVADADKAAASCVASDCGTLGGKAARTIWEESHAARVKCHGAAAAASTAIKGVYTDRGCRYDDSASRSWEYTLPDDSSSRSGRAKPHRQEQQQERQCQKSHQQHQHQHQQQHEQQQKWQADTHQARLWRWLRTPSADWCAADWSFDDCSDGTLLLEMTNDRRQVTALAVRDEKQYNKPCKVYINGTFTAAVLDDIVMEPLSGRLMAVLYRFYTPGVHHLYFCLPRKGASRVLARLHRRWMPASVTWLFPPRSNCHDVGGWSIEWEGHDREDKPGWIHPAVFVLTAACYSREMELRRAAGRGAAAQRMWQHVTASASAARRAFHWLRRMFGGCIATSTKPTAANQ